MFGLFRRRRGGISVLVLIVAICGVLSSCMTLFFGVPTSIVRAREVSNLPIVSAAEMSGLAAGTKGIFAVQIPANATADEVNGLALYYIEERQKATTTPDEDGTSSTSTSNWEVIQPPVGTFEMALTNGATIMVNIPSNTSFMNAETVDESSSDTQERRAIGYRAGQTLTLEGVWDSSETLTAQTLYYGTPDQFVSEIRRAPGSLFLFSIICGVISLGLFITGGVLRFLGR